MNADAESKSECESRVAYQPHSNRDYTWISYYLSCWFGLESYHHKSGKLEALTIFGIETLLHIFISSSRSDLGFTFNDFFFSSYYYIWIFIIFSTTIFKSNWNSLTRWKSIEFLKAWFLINSHSRLSTVSLDGNTSYL